MNVKVIMTGHGRGRVIIDGQEVKGVKSVRFHAGLNEVNTLELSLAVSVIEIEGKAEVSIDADAEILARYNLTVNE